MPLVSLFPAPTSFVLHQLATTRMDADFTVGSSTSGRPNTEIIRKSLNMNGDGGISFAPIRTGYVYDAKMMAHSEYRDNPEDMEEDYENHHPEQPNRIKKIHDKLREAGCIELMYNINARLLNQNEALLVHTEDHWEKVAAIACEPSYSTLRW